MEANPNNTFYGPSEDYGSSQDWSQAQMNDASNKPVDSNGSTGEKRYNYLVSLKKKHVYWLSFFVTMLLLVFFFIGLLIGYRYHESRIGREQNDNPLAQLEESIENKQINSVNQESKLVFEQNIPSAALLKQDQNRTVKQVVSEGETRANGGERSTKKNSAGIVPVPGNEYFYIQVMATSFETKARRIYSEFKKRNYPVKVKKSEKLGKEIYQIRLGLYEDKEKAIKHLRLARNSAGFKEANLVRYRI